MRRLVNFSLMLIAGPALAESGWGKPNPEGLRTRLVPLQKNHRVGKQLAFRLEAENTGIRTLHADLQSLAHAQNQLAITLGDNRQVPCISADLAGCMTTRSYTPFPPGKVVVVAGRLDAAEEFQISKAGTYRFRHPGLKRELPVLKGDEETDDIEGKRLDATTRFTNLPASQEVRLEVGDGKLPADLEMIVNLRPIVPKDWFLSRRWAGEGVRIGHHQPNGYLFIDLVAVDPKAKVALEGGWRKLGISPQGEIRMLIIVFAAEGPEDFQAPKLEDLWPGAEHAICEALKIDPSET